MKPCTSTPFRFAANAVRAFVAGIFLLGSHSANATTYYWDVDGAGSAATGGSGTWDTSSSLWRNGSSTETLSTWPNTDPNTDIAQLAGTGGTITLNSSLVNINVNKIVFGTTGYTIAGPVSGTATLNLSGTTPTIDTGANAATINAVITGSAGLTKDGTGTLTLNGINTFTGMTTVAAGTLSIGDGTTNGTPNGSYQVNGAGTLRLRYAGSGAAAWIGSAWNNITGNGTLALNTTATNVSWDEAALPSGFTGTLQIERGRVGTSSATGCGFGGTTAIKIQAGGHLMDWRGSTITQDLTIAGTGYGENGYECALRLGNSSLSGTVALSASATIGSTATGILTNVVSGAAGSNLSLGTWSCRGTIILAADNSYAGSTTIAYGTLQIGNGGATGSLGAGAVTNNGTLVFNRSGTVSVGQAITGSGAVKQIGSATVTLAAANNYAGATTLTAGTLVLGRSGALPSRSPVSIGSATLNAGTYTHSAGTIGITGVATIALGLGATLAFADSSAQTWIGSLELTGNFVSGTSLRFGTTSSGLTVAQLDRIHVTGFTGFTLNSQGYLTAILIVPFLYSAWQTANSTTQTMSQDLDGDGVSNGLEYFLHGTGVSSAVDVLPGVTGSAGNLSVTWTKAATCSGTYGIDFVIQSSSTLAADSWTNERLGTNVTITGNNVKYNFPAGTKNFARLVVGEPPLVVDTSKAIPLRSHTYRKDQFALSLRGSAISGSTPYEVNFDTGSQQTCLHYGALNKANLKVIQSNVRTVWGTLADKVTGQLILKSRDGLFDYVLDNFTFYAMKNEDGTDMTDDRTNQWSSSICGARPYDPYEQTIVAALMAKYSTNGLGAGIISESPSSDLRADWSKHKSYLKFGNDPAVASRLNWYNWSPWYNGQPAFDAITIPGFNFTFSFPAASPAISALVVPNQIATIDSGAPELTMRMGSGDPHRGATYSTFFNTTNVPSWYIKTNACMAANDGVILNVEFTGSNGKKNSYSFPFSNYKENTAYVPNVGFIGDWASEIPWAPNSTTMPMNRMNLGNSIYFYAKVYFWDFTNQRVGFYFN